MEDETLKVKLPAAEVKSAGSRVTSEERVQRIRRRLDDLRRSQPEAGHQFAIHDGWAMYLFLALAKRYGLRPSVSAPA